VSIPDLSLPSNEGLLRGLLEAIPDRVWVKDLDGRHLACNTAFAAHLGTHPDAVIGTDDAYWFGEDCAREFLLTDRLTAQTGASTSFEGPMPSPRGDDATLYEVVKAPVRDAQGRVIGVLGMGRNIQARKDAERLLRDTTEQLELAIMGADLGRWDHDLTTDKGYYLDERACAMLGRPASEAHIGRAWGHMIHPDDLPATLEAMRAHLNGGASAYEAEYRARHSEGHWVWLSNRGKVVQFSQGGKPLRMVDTLMDVSKRKQVESELRATQAELQDTLRAIEHLAFHDALTGLPNRRLLMDRLDTALTASLRHQRHGAVLFLDLDKFKHLNDNHGHEVGDLMLKEVAQRLMLCVRSVDTVARLGGDEFVVLLQDLSGDAFEARLHATAVGHKILSSLNEPYRLNDNDHTITPSIGAVLFLGLDVAASELIRRADEAMFEAKAEGRNTFCFHQPFMPK
jgi:diguanylate cyclase (GGDEF)-like protein/PAS domain S-box-containing protein